MSEIDELRERVAKRAYTERNRLVALLAAMFPSSIERQPDGDWDEDWRSVVYVDLPKGQASWHIHESDLWLFAHVPRGQGRVWDGTDTNQKHRNIEALTQQIAGAGE